MLSVAPTGCNKAFQSTRAVIHKEQLELAFILEQHIYSVFFRLSFLWSTSSPAAYGKGGTARVLC